MPEWITKLAARILSLTDGRWLIVLTVNGRHRDWTIENLGKVEYP